MKPDDFLTKQILNELFKLNEIDEVEYDKEFIFNYINSTIDFKDYLLHELLKLKNENKITKEVYYEIIQGGGKYYSIPLPEKSKCV